MGEREREREKERERKKMRGKSVRVRETFLLVCACIVENTTLTRVLYEYCTVWALYGPSDSHLYTNKRAH